MKLEGIHGTSDMYINVALNIPSDKTFIYSVPETFRSDIVPGKRVFVPLGKRLLPGYVLEIIPSSTVEKTKDILDVLDTEPLFNEDDLLFYRWVSQYYIYPLGKTLYEILPGGIDLKSNRWIIPIKERSDDPGPPLTASQKKIMGIMDDFINGISLSRLKKILQKNNIYGDIHALQSLKLVSIEDRIEQPDVLPKKEKVVTLHSSYPSSRKLTKNQQSLIDFVKLHGPVSFTTLRRSFKNIPALVKSMEKKGCLHVEEEEICRKPLRYFDIGRHEGVIILNECQETAIQEILSGLQSRRFSPYLLHGVTGSGKTEVYMNAMEGTLRLNGSAIFLVPEIVLTPQLLTRLNRRFQNHEIAVIHSSISPYVRYDQWRRILRGDIRIVVGARSALFAPVKNLKLIIIDEEHDTSYKQDDRMRYNARDMALMKAKLSSATVVIGSATPAVQTYFNAMKGKYTYLVLPSRVEERPLPDVETVDMKLEADGNNAPIPILSRRLKEAMQETLAMKKQILLFLNRRGYHTFMFCPDCGYVFKCLNCAVSMTHHAGAGMLKCHHCDLSVKLPSFCPICRSNRIMQHGTGTERLEEDVRKYFPDAAVGRMDSDTTTTKGSLENILQSLYRHEIDILVGTQMITKGHDFPDVTLVGIVSADTSLNLPDFRAAERTFQLLIQASGRGGRGRFPGKVIIQTFNPDHYAIRRAKDHDQAAFYNEELASRKLLSYPPYSRMVNLHLSSAKKSSGMEGIEKLKKVVKELMKSDKRGIKPEIIGPAEAPISRIKGRYRWQLLLKGKDAGTLNQLTREILFRSAGIGLDVKVDVDPANFM